MAKLFTVISIDDRFNPLNFELDSLARTLFEDNFFEAEVPVGGGYIKVWSGSAWVLKPVKYWTGAAWVQKPLKYWDGAAWTLTPAV